MAIQANRLDKFTSLIAQPALGERRDRDRSICGLTCVCAPITLRQRSKFWPAKVRDLSTTGIGLLISRPMEVGTFLVIHLDGPHSLARPLRAKVVHSTLRRHELGWVVGCELTRQLSFDELDALG